LSTNFNVFQNGDSCDDGNPATSNDMYSNGICVGTMVYASCLEILNSGNLIGNGTYEIDVDSTGSIPPMQVYCDMTTSGGGWTAILGAGSEYNKNNSFWDGVIDINYC